MPATKIFMLDNYDSFTFNLVQYFEELGAVVHICRNDQLSVNDVMKESWDSVVISPGPSDPKHAGITLDLIQACAHAKRRLLGVCLGHQAIGEAFGGKVVRAPLCIHGKTSAIHHQGEGVFRNLPNPFKATRYHSLIIDRASLPQELMVTAQLDDGMIMGVKHRTLPIEGIQFHPESVLTDHGKQLLANWLKVP